MNEQQKNPDLVKELIIINNDRYEGYQTAAKGTKETNLKELFDEYSQQSNDFAGELRRFVPSGEEQPGADETKMTGKLFRAWMEVKTTLSAHDSKAILASCEFGEDTAQKHYEEALKKEAELPSGAPEVIRKQMAELKKAHDRIKALHQHTVS